MVKKDLPKVEYTEEELKLSDEFVKLCTRLTEIARATRMRKMEIKYVTLKGSKISITYDPKMEMH